MILIGNPERSQEKTLTNSVGALWTLMMCFNNSAFEYIFLPTHSGCTHLGYIHLKLKSYQEGPQFNIFWKKEKTAKVIYITVYN